MNSNCVAIRHDSFPLQYQASDSCTGLCSFLDFLANNRTRLSEELIHFGAILFRGFDVRGPLDFEKVIKAQMLSAGRSYSGGTSPRTRLAEGIYTSTEWSPIIRIPVHNEMAYSATFPRVMFFHCSVTPLMGGQTPIANCRGIYHNLPSILAAKFEDRGIQYRRYYPKKNLAISALNSVAKSHKTWMEVFLTDDKCSVEKECERLSLSYDWDSEDGLRLTNILPAVRPHPESGERIWFNQAHTFNHFSRCIGAIPSILANAVYWDERKFVHNVSYGDGGPIAKEDIFQILDVFDTFTVRFGWQAGDVLILDNMLVAHGRDPYLGTRKVYVSLH